MNDFDHLPEKSKQFLAYAARRMAEGWTGTWEVGVQNGGVRQVKETGSVKLEAATADPVVRTASNR